MPLQSSGPKGRVVFEIGVKFDMVDPDRKRTICVALQSDVLDFFESAIRDDDVACFLRHRERIERIASDLYDGGLYENGRVLVCYSDLRNL
jgi:hypothetical protein